ncbi:MAG: protein-L-isoaspartate(D-aspartate) O-methyltransferase [Chloroflexia bacterium]
MLILILTISCAPPATPATPAPASPSATIQDPYLEQRLQMVEETIVARGVSDPDVLRAMRTVPRHLFVPPEYLDLAYDDRPLPIGYGQTISQPYIVAWMTELLQLKPGEKVLEIGTGSGYQAAVLAELGDVEVYSIEIIPELAQQAAERLQRLGYGRVHLTQGDGYFGWPEHAPYDAIIVTAAPDHLPPPLVEQLREGGRLVIPIGPRGGWQTLWRFTKKAGEVKAEALDYVSFVPLTGYGEPPRGGNPRP